MQQLPSWDEWEIESDGEEDSFNQKNYNPNSLQVLHNQFHAYRKALDRKDRKIERNLKELKKRREVMPIKKVEDEKIPGPISQLDTKQESSNQLEATSPEKKNPSGSVYNVMEMNAYLQWFSEQLQRIATYTVPAISEYLNDDRETPKGDLQAMFRRIGLSEASFCMKPQLSNGTRETSSLLTRIESQLGTVMAEFFIALKCRQLLYEKTFEELHKKSALEKEKAAENANKRLEQVELDSKRDLQVWRSKFLCEQNEKETKSLEMISQLREKLAGLEQKHQALIEQKELEAKNATHELEYMEYRLRTEYEMKTEQLEKKLREKAKIYETQIQEKDVEIEKHVNELMIKHDNDLRRVEESQGIQIQVHVNELMSKHENDLRRVEESQGIQIQEKDAEIEKLRREVVHANELMNKHENDLRRVEESHRQQVENFKSRHEEALTAIRKQTQKLSADHKEYVMELTQKHQNKLKQIQAECDRSKQDLEMRQVESLELPERPRELAPVPTPKSYRSSYSLQLQEYLSRSFVNT